MGACHGSLTAVLIAAMWQRLADGNQHPALVTHGDPDALVADLEDLGVPAVVLPELDSHEAEDDDYVDPNQHRRSDAMERLAAGGLLVASPRATEQPVPPVAELGQSNIAVRVGEWIAIDDLAERLVDEGYTVATVAERRGQIAVRGGILDVFPFLGQHGVRIEFFGDEIDTVRHYDPFTQESIARVEHAELVTATGVAATVSLWSQLPSAPVLVCGDVSLAERLHQPHGRREIRLARVLTSEAADAATVAVERFKGDLLHDCRELQQAASEEGSRILVFARNDEAEEQLQQQFAAHGLDGVELRQGRLSAGWRDLEQGLLVVFDFELAHRKPVAKRGRARVAGGAPLSSLSDLKQGDYVVHLKHGIGRFKGMATLEKRGYLEDHLLLEFAEGTKLYVPVSAIDLIQKYIGGAGRHPELSRIGGKAWARRKAQAEKAVEDLTAELLEAQAARLAKGGASLVADSADYARFCARFPYEETEDQLSAMREIREAMALPTAMDRLLCGDVGFGKTEVAMRAAYLAVSAGYQVVVLAPTTLLSEQHAQSFHERFEGTGCELACMNRFRSTASRRDMLERTRRGEIDVLIGTHALLTKDLKFHRLGLLIVDEEQRFGVKQKEHLRSLQAGVDCLILSATPIPRTLHFGMLGLRDISVLAEAPAQRLAVQTSLVHWDGALIRDAIRRELERGGQVFVVHNRVQDIDKLAFKIARLVPELRYEIMHGQLGEERTASIMHAYKHGGIDCLIATSIIESGIDIPNANTLFVNNAHCFGLAELHQIRGRIGRFTRQAYAYFISPPSQKIGQKAIERLDAIQEYVELGAGFKLAMRDLELRGAGNLLGSEQSGHIEVVGYELYCKLLAEAVARHEAELPEQMRPVPIGSQAVLAFPIDAYIPDNYLDAPTLKFELHKSIDSARRLSDLRTAATSAADRYGPLVPSLVRLFQAKAIRLACAKHGISRIAWQDRQVRLELTASLPQLDASGLEELVHIQPDGDRQVVLFLRQATDQDQRLGFLARLMQLDLTFLATAARGAGK